MPANLWDLRGRLNSHAVKDLELFRRVIQTEDNPIGKIKMTPFAGKDLRAKIPTINGAFVELGTGYMYIMAPNSNNLIVCCGESLLPVGIEDRTYCYRIGYLVSVFLYS